MGKRGEISVCLREGVVSRGLVTSKVDGKGGK